MSLGDVLGGIAGGIAAMYIAVRAKSIESFRHALQREGVEHEVRFTRLHEQRWGHGPGHYRWPASRMGIGDRGPGANGEPSGPRLARYGLLPSAGKCKPPIA